MPKYHSLQSHLFYILYFNDKTNEWEHKLDLNVGLSNE